MLKNILIVTGGIAGLFVVYAFLVPMLQNPNTPSGDDMIACTMDAKICPDGTGVGRVGPNCEFAVCPGE
jgi:hypothetical protein